MYKGTNLFNCEDEVTTVLIILLYHTRACHGFGATCVYRLGGVILAAIFSVSWIHELDTLLVC